jgi:hypothetical protein
MGFFDDYTKPLKDFSDWKEQPKEAKECSHQNREKVDSGVFSDKYECKDCGARWSE